MYTALLPIRIPKNVILLPIEAESQDTALWIFSTLNDRGLPLSDADIFKSQFYEYESRATVIMDADENLYGNAWLALLDADESFSFQFNFGLKDEASVEKELLASAVKQARARAEILASAASAKLGGIAGIGRTVRNTFDSYADHFLCCEDSYMSTSSKKDLIPDFNPDDITVYCSIDAAWFIKQARSRHPTCADAVGAPHSLTRPLWQQMAVYPCGPTAVRAMTLDRRGRSPRASSC